MKIPRELTQTRNFQGVSEFFKDKWVVVQENIEQQTIIHCIAKEGSQFFKRQNLNISPKTYLVNREKIPGIVPIDQAIDIPVLPKRLSKKQTITELRFTLIFGAVPSNWRWFTLIEERKDKNGIEIARINKNQTGSYTIILP